MHEYKAVGEERTATHVRLGRGSGEEDLRIRKLGVSDMLASSSSWGQGAHLGWAKRWR